MIRLPWRQSRVEKLQDAIARHGYRMRNDPIRACMPSEVIWAYKLREALSREQARIIAESEVSDV